MFQSSSLKSVCLVFRPPGGAAMFCTRAKSFPGGEASEAHFYSGLHHFSKGHNYRVIFMQRKYAQRGGILFAATVYWALSNFVFCKVKVNI